MVGSSVESLYLIVKHHVPWVTQIVTIDTIGSSMPRITAFNVVISHSNVPASAEGTCVAAHYRIVD